MTKLKPVLFLGAMSLLAGCAAIQTNVVDNARLLVNNYCVLPEAERKAIRFAFNLNNPNKLSIKCAGDLDGTENSSKIENSLVQPFGANPERVVNPVFQPAE